MSDYDDMDFLMDRKKTYLHVWKDEKQIKKIRTTFLDLNGSLLASFLNGLSEKESDSDGQDMIKKFYDAVDHTAPLEVKSRLVLNSTDNVNQILDTSFEYNTPMNVDLKAQYKKLAMIGIGLYLLSLLISTIIIGDQAEYTISIIIEGLIMSIITSAIFGFIVALFPYKALPYKSKILRGILVAFVVIQAMSILTATIASIIAGGDF